jgi:pyruvate formate lyase activating enzyme
MQGKKPFRNRHCPICGEEKIFSDVIGACRDCLLSHPTLLDQIAKRHNEIRSLFKIPPFPQKEGDIACGLCANACLLKEGERGVCGVRIAREGKVIPLAGDEAIVDWYKDPLPTNCVADWVCPGCSGSGFPRFSYQPRAEIGYYNLAVFFGACSFNCLFCQNWHYRTLGRRRGIEELVEDVTEKVSCICFFGGDPTPQLEFAIKSAQLALKKREGKILRICWETNGSMSRQKLEEMSELSLKSGGCIKIDIKAWTREVYFALTGTQARDRVFDNFAFLAKYFKIRPDPPFLIASTLLVPGYVDEEEVEGIAKFIASLDKNIPFALLAFYPCFQMRELPTTSRQHAERCLRKAKEAGLTNIRIGNVHLLSF